MNWTNNNKQALHILYDSMIHNKRIKISICVCVCVCIITFTNDNSRYGYVYLMKHKSKLFEWFKEFRIQVKKQTKKSANIL
jgi:hypothetical protein